MNYNFNKSILPLMMLCLGFIFGVFHAVNHRQNLKIGDALYELEQTYPPPEYSGHEIKQYKNGKWYKSWYRGQ